MQQPEIFTWDHQSYQDFMKRTFRSCPLTTLIQEINADINDAFYYRARKRFTNIHLLNLKPYDQETQKRIKQQIQNLKTKLSPY